MLEFYHSLSKPYKIAFIVVAMLFLWILSSLIISPASDDDEIKSIKSTRDIKSELKIEELTAKNYQRVVTLYGQSEPFRIVNIKAETKGTVLSLQVKEGQFYKKGTIVAKLDLRERSQLLKQAKARLEQRRVEYRTSSNLRKKGFQSKVKVAQARAELERAKADLENIELDINRTNVLMPFDGVIDKLNVEVGDFTGIGVFGGEAVVATVIDINPIIISAKIGAKKRKLIKLGETARITLNDGAKIQGEISYISNVADSQTRTFKVEVTADNSNGNIIAGVAAEMHLPADILPAYFISPSSLSLDDDGNIGVKILDEKEVIQFVQIQIIDDNKDGIWISGLPSKIRLITLGQAFVSAGQEL